MSLEDHKRSVRTLLEEVAGRGQIDLLDQLVDPDALDHNARARGWGAGIEGIRVHARVLENAFPGFTITVDDLIAEGDRVIAFWHFSGVHRGPVLGVEPTQRTVEAHTVTIARFEKGKVVEYESRPDRLGLLLQLGQLGEYASRFEATAA
jgi:predicted ester cyclase